MNPDDFGYGTYRRMGDSIEDLTATDFEVIAALMNSGKTNNEAISIVLEMVNR